MRFANVLVNVLIKVCIFSNDFSAEETGRSTQIGGTSLAHSKEKYVRAIYELSWFIIHFQRFSCCLNHVFLLASVIFHEF
jgi:hypothetical protein